MLVTELAVRHGVGARRGVRNALACAAFLFTAIGARSIAAQSSPGLAPKAAPSAWMGLIGEYGDGDRMLISERDGSLYATVEWLAPYPVRQISTDVFQWPHEGLYGGSRVTFQRGANGRATQLTVGGIVYPRRQIGPESGTQLRITPIRPVEELRTIALAAKPPVEPPSARKPDLVELTTLDSTIKLEIRYATTNNFLGSRMYTEARAFMQRPAAEAVVRASRELHKRGYGLLIHDAYRPWYVTKIFWDATPADKKWLVANPAHGSMHNRGCAVDLTLYDLKTGQPVEMVSTYDESTDRAYADYPGGTSLQRWHRALLRSVMEAEGFTANPQEWWHFDYKDWRDYPIMNVTFEQISAAKGAH
jgi:D-alanyl-D-alanine dipeptidase